jgi:hypothetical protein
VDDLNAAHMLKVSQMQAAFEQERQEMRVRNPYCDRGYGC